MLCVIPPPLLEVLPVPVLGSMIKSAIVINTTITSAIITFLLDVCGLLLRRVM